VIKCENGYTVLEDKEQSRIWEIYDNLRHLSDNFGAADYEEAVQEFEMLAEQIRELKTILQLRTII